MSDLFHEKSETILLSGLLPRSNNQFVFTLHKQRIALVLKVVILRLCIALSTVAFIIF